MEASVLKAIVVEDEQWIRTHIVGKIETVCPECTVVGVADNGQDALLLMEELRPDLVFTDIKMPGMDGLALSRRIKEQYPDVIIVIISGYSEFELAQQAIRYGVFNYLLKPLEDDKLRDTFQDILTIWNNNKRRRNRSVVLPMHTTGGSTGQEMLQAEHYHMLLFCFGNLFSGQAGEEYERYFADYFSGISWQQVLSEECPSCEWVLTDEPAVNQKCLLLAADGNAGLNPQALAHRLKKRLPSELTLHICYTAEPLARSEIWLGIQRLRHILHTRLVLCAPSLFSMESPAAPVDDRLFTAARLRAESLIRTAVHSMDFGRLHEDVLEILRFAQENRFPQKLYEKLMTLVLNVLGFSIIGYDAERAEYLQTRLQWTLCTAAQYTDIETAFLDCVDSYTTKQSASFDREEMMKTILEFVDANFTSIDSVENVAAIFNYNYAYLSRVFKQYTGISMNKYITDKRMENAKNLMQFNPDLTMREIAEAVGYADQHYFSRVFKQVCGVSPREYRMAAADAAQENGAGT